MTERRQLALAEGVGYAIGSIPFTFWIGACGASAIVDEPSAPRGALLIGLLFPIVAGAAISFCVGYSEYMERHRPHPSQGETPPDAVRERLEWINRECRRSPAWAAYLAPEKARLGAGLVRDREQA